MIRLGIGDVTLPLRARGRGCPARRRRRDGHTGGLPRLRTRPGLRLPASTPSASTTIARAASRSTPTRSSSRTARSGTAGNIQEIFGADCRIAVTGSRLPGLRRHQRDGRPHRRGRRDGPLRGHPLPDRATRPTASSRRRRTAGRPRLPLLAQQPDRRRDDARAARARGSRWARDHDAILLFDAAYDAFIQRSRAAALDLRDPGRARRARSRCAASRSGRLHGRSLRLHRGAEGAQEGRGGERVPLRELWARRQSTKFNGVAVRGPARRRGDLHARGSQADGRAGRLLHGERADPAPRPRAGRLPLLRRRARALRLDADAARASTRGPSSTACSPRRTSSARRAAASAPPARAISASRPSTAGRTWKRRSRG